MDDLSERQIQALASCLQVQERDSQKDGWLGFLWSEVHVPPATLNSLVSLGFLDLAPYSSRAYKYYRIHDTAKVRKLLDAYSQGQPIEIDDSDLIVPNDLFDIIVGHDQTKNIVKMSLAASDPVHILLVGRPATAKTLFLSELARLPGSRLALGGTSSRAGIVDFLLDARPRYLIIDEIDKANSQDLDVLLSLMETGLVTRLKRGMREQTKLRTWVYAGANSDRWLSDSLKSRFINRHLPDYTQSDFEAITRAILSKREKIHPAWIDEIVQRLSGKTLDPRDSVKVARLVQDRSQIADVISTIWG